MAEWQTDNFAIQWTGGPGGGYRLGRWTDDVKHADPCDCDEDEETVGDACLAGSESWEAVFVDSGAHGWSLIGTLGGPMDLDSVLRAFEDLSGVDRTEIRGEQAAREGWEGVITIEGVPSGDGRGRCGFRGSAPVTVGDAIAIVREADLSRAMVYEGIHPVPSSGRVADVWHVTPGSETSRLIDLWSPLPLHEAQVVRYQPGGLYVPHHDADEAGRRHTTVVIGFSDPDTYGGGELSVHSTGVCAAESMRLGFGDVVAFPSARVHEVSPVEWGERWVIVGWSSEECP